MKTFSLEIKQELVNYIERLDFEIHAKERIVRTMLADTSYENLMENENFLNYQRRYEEAVAEYELAKQEITNMIPAKLQKEHRVSWNLIFATFTLEITIECDCFDDFNSIEEVFAYEKA